MLDAVVLHFKFNASPEIRLTVLNYNPRQETLRSGDLLHNSLK
jgi:hypothetical protein